MDDRLLEEKIIEALKVKIPKSQNYIDGIRNCTIGMFTSDNIKNIKQVSKIKKATAITISTIVIGVSIATAIKINQKPKENKEAIASNIIVANNNETLNNDDTNQLQNGNITQKETQTNTQNIISEKVETKKNNKINKTQKVKEKVVVAKVETSKQVEEVVNDQNKTNETNQSEDVKNEVIDNENKNINNDVKNDWEIETSSIENAIIKYNGLQTKDLIIPSTINGTKLTRIKSIGEIRLNLEGKLTISEGITNIITSAFESSKIETIKLPSTLQIIGKSVFANCKNLSGEIEIPNGVTSIGISSFENDEKITSFEVPESITLISDNAFAGTGIIQITIPSKINTMGEKIFANCKNLTNINMNIPSTSSIRKSKTFDGMTGKKVEVKWSDGVIDTYENGILAEKTENPVLPGGSNE